jgi:subtilisin family serine protease
LFAAVLVAVAVAACQTVPTGEVVHLRSRDVVPMPEGVSAELSEALKTTPLPRLHVFVKLRRRPNGDDAKLLDQAGMRLLFHVTPQFWVASVVKDFKLDDRQRQALVQWVGAIEPRDKVEPRVYAQQFYKWATDESGRARLAIEFFRDIPRDEAERLLKSYAVAMTPWAVGNGWHVVVPKTAIEALARLDPVKWIEQGPPPMQPLNYFTRRALHGDEVQQIDLTADTPSYHGLTGAGVTAGFWDTGIDATHDDFLLHDESGAVTGSRIVTSFSLSDPHGTAVAGVIGASGYRCIACGLTPYDFRGMAPEVSLLPGVPHPIWGPTALTIGNAIRTHGMDVSNHSYVQTTDGRYLYLAEQIDLMVRGTTDAAGLPVPPRPMVWGAGNNGMIAEYDNVEGYFSVEAPAKNGITVGATIGNVAGHIGHLADFSSLGPTWDGRIKPELVAPGETIRTTQNDTDCYTVVSGTSVAAPAVTGTLALMLQQYSLTYGVDLDAAPPLPSTSKAVLVQTATDLTHTAADAFDRNNPDTGAFVQYHAGPDYATGYGQVNALAAVSLIKEKNLLEGRIASRSQVDEHTFWVSPGSDRIQFTLAWDDEPFEGIYASETASKLVNDLELSLIAPDGTTHLPWVLAPLTPAAAIGERDPIAPGDITPATHGRDHLNNLEQVTVERPASGRWIARVRLAESSPGLLAEPQPYSLAGDFGSRFYFTDWAESPGSVYEIRDGVARAIHTSTRGRIYHAAFAPDGTLYVSNSNDTAVQRVPSSGAAETVYRHGTYVRDIAFDPSGRFYFSEASGARTDGTIYQLDLASGRATPFFRVQLAAVGGFWAGDFAFDAAGKLYLSTGNRIGGRIYRLDEVPAPTLVSVYALPDSAVTGIAFNRRGEMFYTNWDRDYGNIYRVTLADGRRDLVYSFPGRRIWDLAFR